MRASLLLLGVFGCGGSGAPTARVDNTGGGDRPHAPCFPDRETISARELYDAASAGPPGACTLVDAIDERGGDAEFPVKEIRDGDVVVGTVDPCGVTVRVPRVNDERGIAVGDPFEAILAGYAPPKVEYALAGGLGGEAQLSLHMGGLDLAWFELEGMGPPSPLDGEAAIEAARGQLVASYRAVFMCD